jgi:hypothetical protein
VSRNETLLCKIIEGLLLHCKFSNKETITTYFKFQAIYKDSTKVGGHMIRTVRFEILNVKIILDAAPHKCAPYHLLAWGSDLASSLAL